MNRVEQYYGQKDPGKPQHWSLVKALQKSLKDKMVMKLNSIDNDKLKIRLCNNGKGAELPTNQKNRDESVDQF